MRYFCPIGIILLFLQLVNAEQLSSSLKLEIDNQNNKILLMKEGCQIISIDSLCFDFYVPSAIKVLSNSENEWKIQLSYSSVSLRDEVYDYADRKVELNIIKNGNEFWFKAACNWASTTTIYLSDLGGHVYGISEPVYPSHTNNPDLRGEVLSIKVKSEHSRYFENCASVWSALYFNTKGFISFYNTFAEGEYKFAINGKTTLFHHTNILDWHIIVGDNGNELFSQYYNIIGAPKYIPDWACGPIIWRDNNKGGKDEVLDDAGRFTEMEIPFTTLLVDRPYSNGNNAWSKMDFNDDFANPKEWIKTLNEKYGVEFLTWIASATFGDNDFPGILPGSFGYFDLSNPEAVSEFDKRLGKQYDLGVVGHKLDRADEYFPVGESWYDKTPMQERLNKYAFLYSKVTDEILNKHLGKYNYNVARAAFHGSQKYLSAVWGGDIRTSWEGMAASMANAIRCSYMGFPNWGTNVGGYKGNTGQIPDDLYARWLQWGVWTGNFQIKIDGNGGRGEDRPPWKCSETVQNIFRESCELRMELIPYIYSHLNSADENGVLMKPLSMEFIDDENTHSIWDEYLFGHSFLVAPILSDNNNRKVYLPEGEWISFNDPERVYNGKSAIKVSTDINYIPVYVKANTIFVTGKTIKGNIKAWNEEENQIVVNAYIGSKYKSAEFDYVDSAEEDKVKNIAISGSDDHIIIVSEQLAIKANYNIYSKRKPAKVVLNNKEVEYEYDGFFITGVPLLIGQENILEIKF